MIRELWEHNRKVAIIAGLILLLLIGIVVSAIVTNIGGREGDIDKDYMSAPEIEPSFDTLPDSELERMLGQERANITRAINSALAGVDEQSSIREVKLLGNGQYAVASLSVERWISIDTFDDSEAGLMETETYRLVLRQDDNGRWQVVGYPRLIFSYFDLPDIPRPVVRAANAL